MIKNLTDEQILEICRKVGIDGYNERLRFARKIIAADRALNAADRDVMQQALNALYVYAEIPSDRWPGPSTSVIAELEAALSASPTPPAEQQGEQEPVLYAMTWDGKFNGNVYETEEEANREMHRSDSVYGPAGRTIVPLYTRPSPSLAILRAKVEALPVTGYYGCDGVDEYVEQRENFLLRHFAPGDAEAMPLLRLDAVLAEIDKLGGGV